MMPEMLKRIDVSTACMQGLTVASWGAPLLHASALDRTLIVPDNPGMVCVRTQGTLQAL